MTLSAFENYVRNRHNAIGKGFWSSEEIFQILTAKCQEALSYIGLLEAEDTSITTVASTGSYNLPTEFETVVEVLYNGDPLELINFAEWRGYRQTGGSTIEGTPEAFTIFARKLFLIPTPSAAETVTIYGEKRHGDITASTDTFSMPDITHFALADGVIADMYAKDEKPALYDRYNKKWENHIDTTFRTYKRAHKRRARGARVIHVETGMGILG